MLPKLGVLAGGGQLPAHVIAACRAQAREHFVIAFRGFTNPDIIAASPHEWVALEKVGRVIRRLHEERVRDVVLAGPVRRPSHWLEFRPDWRAVRLLAKMATDWHGDNHILSLIVRELEGEGFHVVGAEAVAPDLLAPEGLLGRHALDERQRADIDAGIAAARELGARDRGQAAVVAHGRVIGREARGGTAALLEAMKLDGLARGGVLVKIAKPRQERRVDLPSIGVETIHQAAAAGLAGVAIEAGGALVIGRAEIAHAADEHGLFVVGVSVSQEAGR